MTSFSIILDLNGDDFDAMHQSVASLLDQSYTTWDLIVTGHAGPVVSTYLQQVLPDAGRFLIAGTSPDVDEIPAYADLVSQARGGWVSFMEEGDVLDPHALAEFACYINNNSDAAMVYCDHDYYGEGGQYSRPHFKPDWSPEFLINHNYLDNTFSIRKEFIQDTGGISRDRGLSPIRDLLLRAAECKRKVGHIPRLLFHKPERHVPGTFEIELRENRGIRTIKYAMQRRGISCDVRTKEDPSRRGMFSLKFKNTGPGVGIVIPTKNKYQVLRTCIDSIEKTSYDNYRVYIIDNESTEREILEYLKAVRHQVIRICSPEGKFNYSYLNNKAVREHVAEEYVLFLNNDTEIIDEDWLSSMVGWLNMEGIGAVGAKLIYGDGRIQHCGIVNKLLYGSLPAPAFKTIDGVGYNYYPEITRDCSAVTAACMLTRKELFLESGGFDEQKFAVAYNDVDYCFRLVISGLRVVYCAEACLYHHEGATRGTGVGNDNPAEEAEFIRRYGDWADPYYNPNLALWKTDFSLNSRTVRTGKIPELRIMLISHNLNYEGAPIILYEIAAGLLKSGNFSFEVLSHYDGPLREKYESAGIRVHVIDPSGIFTARNDLSYEQALFHIRKKVRIEIPDVIVANTMLSFWGIDLARELNTPSIWIIHESEPPFTHLRDHGEYIVNRGIRNFASVYQMVFVADSTRQLYSQFNYRNNHEVFYNGFDLSRFDWNREEIRKYIRKEVGVAEDELLSLSVGTVCERKGQLDLVKAIHMLDPEKVERIKFVIIGDRASKYSDEIKNLIRELPLEKKLRLLIIPEDEKAYYFYAAADLFIMNSLLESFPKVIQEAMYFGLPIITTPVFGVREQVYKNTSALFYESGDIRSLTDNIEALIDSPDLRKRIGANAGISFYKLPSYQNMIDRYSLLLQEAWLVAQPRN